MTIKQTKSNRRIGDGTPGPGRPKGCANKATATVRDAIARVLEGNVENFSRWLAAVAEGEKETAPASEDGKTAEGSWIRKPDPGAALKLAMDMAEYHIPKLARTELTGEIGIRGKLIIGND
jgi:uncharacterized protein (DUF2126 family)